MGGGEGGRWRGEWGDRWEDLGDLGEGEREGRGREGGLLPLTPRSCLPLRWMVGLSWVMVSPPYFLYFSFLPTPLPLPSFLSLAPLPIHTSEPRQERCQTWSGYITVTIPVDILGIPYFGVGGHGAPSMDGCSEGRCLVCLLGM